MCLIYKLNFIIRYVNKEKHSIYRVQCHLGFQASTGHLWIRGTTVNLKKAAGKAEFLEFVDRRWSYNLRCFAFTFRQHKMKEDAFKCYSKMAGGADQENALEFIRLLLIPLTLLTWKVISFSANKR